jgi:hypothetical protein
MAGVSGNPRGRPTNARELGLADISYLGKPALKIPYYDANQGEPDRPAPDDQNWSLAFRDLHSAFA